MRTNFNNEWLIWRGMNRFLRHQVDVTNGLTQMKADEGIDETARTLRILGLVILFIGLSVAVVQAPTIWYDIHGNYLDNLIGPLSWVAVGMAIELFGMGLIIFGNRK